MANKYLTSGHGPRAEAHDETSALLRALALVQQALIDKATELRRDPKFANVTHELSIDGPTRIEDFPEDARAAIRQVRDQGNRQIVISGYVDAKPEGDHGCAWLFDVSEGAEYGWRLDRTVTLYPHDGDEIEVDLATTTFANWADAAADLPRLIAELLSSPIPTKAT